MRLCQKLLRSVHLRQMFVPRSAPVRQPDVDQLQTFVNRSEKLMVLTGAGISTESGIPDYRSAGTGLYARTNQRPIQYKDFLQNASSRQRYWARNFVGWPRFSSVEPNRTHLTLSDWESKGKSFWLVTQNVDCLHYKAGSKRVTELHGSAHRCTCLSCNNIMKRWDLQKLFQQYNPDWTTEYITESIAPDGDVLLLDEQIKDFEVPPCQNCGGILKPDIVFFGDNVAKPVVNFVFEVLGVCDSILVAGSSLYVYSAYRFLQRASEQGKMIAIVNIGETRADHLAHLKVDARCGQVFPRLTVNS